MVKYRYFNTREEAHEWCQKNMKKLKWKIAFTIDRMSLYPKEIESYFGNRSERFLISGYRTVK
jgi:hypothetical protein